MEFADLLALLRRGLFWVAVVVGAVALVDWLVRTRQINPFGPVAQFMRRVVDPLMKPVENRIVRAGGQPASAPWWTLVLVVVGGLVLISALEFFAGLARQLAFGLANPTALWRVLVSWAFGLLRIALIVRVVSTWFGISQYSRWVRWTIGLTEWMLAPLRRVLPLFGAIDISPLLAFFLLGFVEGMILR